jgi:phage-related protein
MAQVEIEIIAKNEGASKAIDNVSGALNRLKPAASSSSGIFSKFGGILRGFGGMLSSVFTTAMGFLSAQVFSRLASELANFGREAFNATVDWERLGFSLQTMLEKELRAADATLTMDEAFAKSRDSAQALLLEIQKLAIRTPFTTEQVANVFRMQMQYGQTSQMAKDLTVALLNMAAATGASNEQIGLAGYALAQISNTSHVYMQDLRQLMGAGIDVSRILQRMGKGFEDVGQGAVDSQEFIQAFLQAASEDFGNASKNIEGTWAGLAGALQDIKQIGLREIFQGILDPVKPLVGDFVNWVLSDAGLARLRQIGDNIGKWLAPIADKLRGLFSGKSLGEVLGDVLPLLGPLGALLGAVLKNVGPLQTALEPIGKIIDVVASRSFPILTNALNTIMTTLSPLIANALPPLIALFAGLGLTLLQTLMPTLTFLITSALPPLINAFMQLAIALSPIITSVIPVLLMLFSGLFVTLAQTILPILVQLITTLLPPLALAFMGLINAIMPLIAVILPPLAQIIGVVADVLGQIVGVLVTSVIPAFIELIGAITPIIAEILPILVEAISSVITAFMPLIKTILPIVASLIRFLASVIQPLITLILPILVVILGVVVGVITGLIDVVKTLIDKVGGPLRSSLDTLTSIFNEKVKPAIQAVKDKMEPLIDVFTRIKDKVSDLIKWIGDLATKLLGLSVPDLFTPGSPTPFEMGLRGIHDAMRQISRTSLPELTIGLRSNLGSVRPALPNALAAGVSGGNGATVIINYQPTASFADEREIREKFAPVVYDAVRRLQADRRIK